ncbi:ionotropic receptor 21a isoform X2 [Diprion similis]|uniref:ionotropic receptor 21a isoform X2 n=1 Tax=Diprion similis TaxID=362088 RepID=UPI001EF7EA90|nr:ionotropic receptor 21a isoform X2 [Diprion similis]
MVLGMILSVSKSVWAAEKFGRFETREGMLLSLNTNLESESLLGLLTHVGENYFKDCSTTVILYDDAFETRYGSVLEEFLKNLPSTYVKKRVKLTDDFLQALEACRNHILLLENLNNVRNALERQSDGKVVVVTGASSWDVLDFLKSPASRLYKNLLVIARSTSRTAKEGSFVLYTHELYSDGIGSSRPVILTSWIKDRLTRPNKVLFPQKLESGFNGHRFRVSAMHKPPFAFRRVTPGTDTVQWDGVDIRVIRLLSKMLNFTIDVRDPTPRNLLGPVSAVMLDISSGKASMGLGGLYRSVDLMRRFDTMYPHTHDCAAFISLTSTALPKYRAVLGPFRQSVWVTLIFAYLGAIIPLTLSSKSNLLRLVTRPKELMEMFWFVFSTFTNCFTIRSPLVYEGLAQNASAILIGLYWVFTIIITSCYTSSIIAFITIPVYPPAIDTSDQLLYYRYRVGTLDHDGWEYFFKNSSDPNIVKLLKNLELVPTLAEGIRNASRAYFWPYALLGSRAMLEYIVQADFAPNWKTKRSLMHISRECFVQFGVTVAFPKGSTYTERMSKVAQRAQQAGLVQKITSDVKWDVQRSSTGKLLQVSAEKTLHIPSAEERQLTLDDIQGMFIVLGSGVLISLLLLILECVYRKLSKHCTAKPRSRSDSETDAKSNDDLSYGVQNRGFDDYPWEYEIQNVTRYFRNSI